MFTFLYPITRLALSVALHDLRQSNPLISVLFVWLFQPACRGLGATGGWFMRICALLKCWQGTVASAGQMSWERVQRKEGGEDFLKGVQAIWSSSGCSYVVSGRCSVEQWLISIKPLSQEMTLYGSNYTDNIRQHLGPRNVTGMCYVDDCIEVCLYLFFLGGGFTMQIEDSSAHLQFSSGGFHPSVLGWFRSLSVLWVIGLFPSVWRRLSAEALLVECGCSLDVFTPVLAGYGPNVVQIGEGFWSRVVILTPLWAPQGCNHFPQPSGQSVRALLCQN